MGPKSSQFLENLQRADFGCQFDCLQSDTDGFASLRCVKDEPFAFAGLLELWIVNSLSGSAALLLVLSIMGLAMHKISSSSHILCWLVQLSYPIYVFHLMFVISISGTLMFGINDWIVVLLGFASGILFPVIIYYAFISWTPLDWVFNGYKNSKCRSKSALISSLARYL